MEISAILFPMGVVSCEAVFVSSDFLLLVQEEKEIPKTIHPKKIKKYGVNELKGDRVGLHFIDATKLKKSVIPESKYSKIKDCSISLIKAMKRNGLIRCKTIFLQHKSNHENTNLYSLPEPIAPLPF
jgi:hypothetical protein